MAKTSVHSTVYNLSNALSNILLAVDAGDCDYEDIAEIKIVTVGAMEHYLTVICKGMTLHSQEIV